MFSNALAWDGVQNCVWIVETKSFALSLESCKRVPLGSRNGLTGGGLRRSAQLSL